MRDTSLADWLAGEDDDLPEGLRLEADEDEPPTPASRRTRPPRRLWLVAAVAWALVSAVVITVFMGSDREGAVPDGPAAAGRAVGEGPGSPDGTGTPGVAPSPVADGTGTPGVAPSPVADGAAASARDDDAVAAVAALAVRLTHTQHDALAGTSRYVDSALPSAVTWYGDLAVVTVDALVLDGDAQGWAAPRPVRYAQPMRQGPRGPAPAGSAWIVPASTPLPGEDGTPGGGSRLPELEPVDDPGALAATTAALAAAGYTEIEVERVGRPAGLPGILVAVARALAPGEMQRGQHEVWVSDGIDSHVLGSDRAVPVNPPREEEP